MNQAEYRKKLKRALRYAPRAIRLDILKDFDNLLQESDFNEQDIVTRLGTPESLAEKYLEDAQIPTAPKKRFFLYARNALMVLGIIVFGLITIGFILYYYYSNHRYFEYSKQELAWQNPDYTQIYNLQDIDEIKIDQAQVVFYSHDKLESILHCQGSNDDLKKGVISRNACLAFLPKTLAKALKISVTQSQLILIRPQTKLEVFTHQSEVQLIPQPDISISISSVKDSGIDQEFKRLFTKNDLAMIRLNFDQSAFKKYD